MSKVLTLGEIMLRLSTTSEERFNQSDTLAIHYGGGEANVAISLANFGHQVFFASQVPNNIVGQAAKLHLQQYGVRTDYLLTGGGRLGSYYVETGIGQRASTVTYDRQYSSFSQLENLVWKLDSLFEGVELFHISGITPALSPKWQELTLSLIQAAKKAGVKISFDINYRSKLWSQKAAGRLLQKVLPYVDYCSAGILDATYLLGIEKSSKEDELADYYQAIQHKYPNLEVIYSTIRDVQSSTVNAVTGTLWMEGTYYESRTYVIDPIVDRIGGGDAFSGGILHGLLSNLPPQEVIDFATAATVLKHTVIGDCNQFNELEVNQFKNNGNAKINR